VNPAVALDPVARREYPPYCYLRQSLWWRVESKRGYPSAAISSQYSSNLLALYRDMLARPKHYGRKPPGTTDYQWSKN
jgi:hypothetical protein